MEFTQNSDVQHEWPSWGVTGRVYVWQDLRADCVGSTGAGGRDE